MYVACQNDAKVVRYLFKDDKILQIGEMGIPNPTVIAVLPNNEQQWLLPNKIDDCLNLYFKSFSKISFNL